MQDRVVITGMGAVCPIGLTVDEAWKNATNGVSGVGPITLFDATDWSVSVAAEVKNFSPENYINPREVRRQDRCEHFASAAVLELFRTSGFQVTEENAPRTGVIISTAIGGIKSLQDAVITLQESGPRRISPFTIPMMMPNGAAGHVAIEHGLKGPCFSVTSACASGNDGIGMAWMMIKAGVIDAAIAGATETTICSVGVGTFDRVGAMSKGKEFVPRPFDKERDGLVMGEGAGLLMLERESHAKARGANILAELAGYAATADAFHITAPAENGEGAARAMRLALQSAGVNPEQVGYVSAHGTGTDLNDMMETRAIKTVLGEHAYKTLVSSTKSMTGHMMGATGALEAIFCVQAVREGIVPPTINYHTPDPECDLNYTPNEARETHVEVAVNNAFGFGGHNAVLVIRKYH